MGKQIFIIFYISNDAACDPSHPLKLKELIFLQ